MPYRGWATRQMDGGPGAGATEAAGLAALADGQDAPFAARVVVGVALGY